MKLSRAMLLLSALVFALVTLSSCSSGKGNVITFPIGQRVQVGKLFYQVTEAKWITEIQGAKQPPKNRILQLHLTVTNGGTAPATLPFLRLMDAAGAERTEVSDLEQNQGWLGMLRRLAPSRTEEGFVYFDVPVGAYKLEVVDNSNADDEKIAYIEIPASLTPPTQAPGAIGI
jgi:hypothetical protein